MSDYYHFFGIKDKQNRFMMRLVNPFGFNITKAQIKLQELYSTHGACPANNEVTWSPWNAGKTLYQFWNVTPNKLGLIRSATPSLVLDGATYKGLPTYLLSMDDYTKIHANSDSFPNWRDLASSTITGKISDFVPVNIGELDTVNMTGIFINTLDVAYDWNTISAWIDNGNIFIDCNPDDLTNEPFTGPSYRALSIGDYVVITLNETELSPIYNKPASMTFGGGGCYYSSISPPGGWTARVIAELDVATVRYTQVFEIKHDATVGRYIALAGTTQLCRMPAWWYTIILLQYSMMKLTGVSAYYTE